MRLAELKMKGFLKDKGTKFCILIPVIVPCLGIFGGCVSNDFNSRDDINGYYEYEETIYHNPMSSYLVTKDNADNYLIADDSLTIMHTDGTKEEIAAAKHPRIRFFRVPWAGLRPGEPRMMHSEPQPRSMPGCCLLLRQECRKLRPSALAAT